MTRLWRKLGRLYAPESSSKHVKLLTHAANPLPIHIAGDIYRVFYSGRDDKNRSSVGAVDIDIVKSIIVADYYEPFFTYGRENSFYSHGVSIGNCYEADGKRYILFMGWQVRPDRHWRGDIGRLLVNDDLSLSLDSEEPFIASDQENPISLSYPWVEALTEGGYRMWYGSTVSWDAGNGEMLHIIKSAVSSDGHHWLMAEEGIPYKIGVAQAFSRPTVVIDDDNIDMWFSYRCGSGIAYRIGHACKKGERAWELDLEKTVLSPSESGWDSEMVEYPFVFEHKGKKYMLYNGNGYGKSGFGLAVLEDG